MGDKEAQVEIVQAVCWLLFGIFIICGITSCHRDSQEAHIKLKAIETGLHQDDNGYWTK